MSYFIQVADHILFEDQYILVLNKPAGLMVEPDRNGHPNLLHQVKQYLKYSQTSGEEVYAQHIHRLDRPVSGIVLFAKQRQVLHHLSNQFAERKVEKYYEALTAEEPEKLKDTLIHWHRKEKKKAVLQTEEFPYAERAQLDYDVQARYDHKGQFLWSIQLHTGKYHQIRAQLSSIGCPILGDHMYGSTVNYTSDAIALNACRLVFMHPVTEQRVDIRHFLWTPFTPSLK